MPQRSAPKRDAEAFTRQNEAACAKALRRDGRRSLGENLEEGAALGKFVHEFAAAFKHARR